MIPHQPHQLSPGIAIASLTMYTISLRNKALGRIISSYLKSSEFADHDLYTPTLSIMAKISSKSSFFASFVSSCSFWIQLATFST